MDHVDAGVLSLACDQVGLVLTAHGARVVRPYLRDLGPTRSADAVPTVRSG